MRLKSNDDFWLVHVTPISNVNSILKNGLDPRIKYPLRKEATSYLVRPYALMWAIAHVAQRHDVKPHGLGIVWTTQETIGANKFFNRGVYVSRMAIPPTLVSGMENAEHAMREYSLARNLEGWIASIATIPF